MPRARKQVARFDPSPEVVASWNDTSGKTRAVVDLQARVRLGLSSAEAAAAAIAAAQKAAAAAAAEQNRIAAAACDRRPPAGRKRQRSAAAMVGNDRRSSSNIGRKWPPTMAGLRTGHHPNAQRDGGGGGSAVSSSAATDSSSVGFSTSGSDSDSSYSLSSETLPSSSRVNNPRQLTWRPPLQHRQPVAAAAAAGTANGAGGSSASASGASDTDSEYSSDLTPGQQRQPACGGGSMASCVTISDACCSCSTTPLGYCECPGAGGPDNHGRGSPDGDSCGGGSGGGGGKSQTRDGEGDAVERRRATKKRRNVVTVRVARSQVPSRWAAPPPPFETCLKNVRPEDKLGAAGGDGGAAAYGGDDAAAAAAASMLGLCEGDVVDAKNWLSSGFIDVVMAKFARTYTNVHFMPIDFAVLCLNGWGAAEKAADVEGAGSSSGRTLPAGAAGAAVDALADEKLVFKDILGRPIVYSERRPVIFLTHVNNVHWNLLRVEHDPVPELQLFEPMGKPPRRQGGSRYAQQQPGGGGGGARGGGFRCIPKEVYKWLDTVWPLLRPGESNCGGGGSGGGSRRKALSLPPSRYEGWASRAYSAITRQQQTTGFDCGVASLLYAEKCGQGQMREDVDAWTTQDDLTEYRRALQRYVEEVLHQPDVATPATATAANADADAAESSSGACPADPEVVEVDPPPSPARMSPYFSASPAPQAAVAVPAAVNAAAVKR